RWRQELYSQAVGVDKDQLLETLLPKKCNVSHKTPSPSASHQHRIRAPIGIELEVSFSYLHPVHDGLVVGEVNWKHRHGAAVELLADSFAHYHSYFLLAVGNIYVYTAVDHIQLSTPSCSVTPIEDKVQSTGRSSLRPFTVTPTRKMPSRSE